MKEKLLLGIISSKKQPQVHNISHTVSLSLWIFMTSFSLDNPEAQALVLFRMLKYFTFYIYFYIVTDLDFIEMIVSLTQKLFSKFSLPPLWGDCF